VHVDALLSEDELQKKRENRKPMKSKPFSPKPFLSFPQRFSKVKLNAQFRKFLDVLKTLLVDIPFIGALSQMPMYAKFLK